MAYRRRLPTTGGGPAKERDVHLGNGIRSNSVARRDDLPAVDVRPVVRDRLTTGRYRRRVGERDREARREVEVRAILDLEVQVGFGGVPGVSTAADPLAPLDRVAFRDTDTPPFEAGKEAVLLLVVPDHDDVADVDLSCRSCSWLVVVPLLVALQLDARVGAALARLGDADADWLVWEVPRPSVHPATDGPGDVVVELAENGRTAAVVVDDDLTVRRAALDGEEL